MRNVKVSGYEPIADQKDVETVICIEGMPPRFKELEEYRAFYKDEAGRLFEALANSLPGGTLDQLLVLLLENKASLFRIKA